MKAVRIHSYGGSQELRLDETPLPSVRPSEVLVQIYAAGVNPFDWKIRSGLISRKVPTSFPLTMGQDFSGEIVDVGVDVRNFNTGDEVFGFASGSYAEYAVIPAKELCRKPKNIDHFTAAAIPTAGLTAWQILMDVIKISAEQVVLIHGAAGGVGSFAVQLAKWKGARVFATALSSDIPYLKSLGVDLVIDAEEEAFEDRINHVDAVIDLLGGDVLNRSYSLVKTDGIIVTTVDSIDEAELRMRSIRGVEFLMSRNTAELNELARLLDQGIVKVRIGQVLPLVEARKAQDMNQRGESHGKIILKVA